MIDLKRKANCTNVKVSVKPFSKVCGFRRQSLWTLSAESGTLLPYKTQERVKKQSGGLFLRGNPRRGFPFDFLFICTIFQSELAFSTHSILCLKKQRILIVLRQKAAFLFTYTPFKIIRRLGYALYRVVAHLALNGEVSVITDFP